LIQDQRHISYSTVTDEVIIGKYKALLAAKDFPCIAARAALLKDQLTYMVAGHLACPLADNAILDFIYSFVEDYRKSSLPYHSAVVIFKHPLEIDEKVFDQFMWQRLQSLADKDSLRYHNDKRVSAEPWSAHFSFSLKEEAFFIIGMHANSSRAARRFMFPTLVFNPHQQFTELRELNRYDKMKQVVRKRDIAFSGSINPTLEDFDEASEVYQYSGLKHDEHWKCPLNSRDAKT